MDIVIPIKIDSGGERLPVHMPTELRKARHHLGQAQGTGNAKGTVPPREPEGNGDRTIPRGAPKPESVKTGQQKDISKRGGHKPPHSDYKTGVSGMESDAVDNYLVLTNVETGKNRNLRLGSAHKAKFDHSGNLVRVTIDGKKYPVQNHLVKLPRGVYRFSGMHSVAAKVGKPNG